MDCTGRRKKCQLELGSSSISDPLTIISAPKGHGRHLSSLAECRERGSKDIDHVRGFVSLWESHNPCRELVYGVHFELESLRLLP
jgi:hypothetical protein